MNSSPSPILPAIVLGLLAFVWLDHINPPFALTNDGIRDQLLARDCTDLHRCHMVGANASLPGFHHGPVWLDLLIGVRLLGGDTTAQRTVVIALMALSVATLFVVVWRWLRPSIALPAAVLYAAALSADTYPSLLINPSITALPNVLTAAGILCYGLSGRRRFLLVAAFALGAGVSVHIAALSLALALLALPALRSQRPAHATLLAVAVAVVTYGLSSSAALRANAIALAQPGRLLPGGTAMLALVALCVRLGPAFRRLGWEGRATVTGLLLIVPFALAAAWLVVREQHPLNFMYLHPILAPAAVLVAVLLLLPFDLAARWRPTLRWIPTGVALVVGGMAALMGLVGWPTLATTTPGIRGWTAADARAIAGVVVAHGWEYEKLMFRLQSRACRELLTGLSFLAPAPGASAAGPHSVERRALQIVQVSHGAIPRLPATHAIVALGQVKVAIVREIDSWLQPEALRACRLADGVGAPRCAPAHTKVVDAIGAERFLFITRAFPEIHSLDVARPYTATYEIPLVVQEGGTRDLAMIDENTPDCGWRITRVDGLRAESALPARRVRLHAAQGASGLLVVERRFGLVACGADDGDLRYPPCAFEAAVDDPLLALVAP